MTINNAFSTLLTFILLSTFSCFAEQSIPQQLKGWETWVLKGNEALGCPFINQTEYANTNNHICAWPSVLDINANQQGAEFRQSWKVLAKSVIPLPGNRKNWPVEVKVNNKSSAILDSKGQPFIELEKGSYTIEGKLSWQKMPTNISLPKAIGLINMSINGKDITFPKIENNTLWFQESEQGQIE